MFAGISGSCFCSVTFSERLFRAMRLAWFILAVALSAALWAGLIKLAMAIHG
jgi:hypothetical protein